VLDLFGGVGLFSLPLSGKSESVTNVESSRFAVNDARANAKAAGTANVSVRRGAVEDVLAGLRPQSGECILADPPRGGLGRMLIGPLVAREPERIVYVSCDPPALARDLKLFADAGYRAEALSCFDLFPDTFHVETVCQLCRST
jgi:tRNA/tmRNA/rRNA uracil-C5-methylase (TrmA/RlmC/RlmD family)